MNKFINAIKNWWNPFGYEEISSVLDYKFEPKEDITAYELHLCKSKPIVCFLYKNIEQYKCVLDIWYKELPDNCKRHFISYHQKIIEYKHW